MYNDILVNVLVEISWPYMTIILGMNFNPSNSSLQFGDTAWTFSWDYMQVGVGY